MAHVYPFKTFHYKVKFVEIGEAVFSEIIASDFSTDPIEYRDGNQNSNFVHKQSSLLKYSNIILIDGKILDEEVSNWIRHADNGIVERCNAKITLNDDRSQTIAEWSVENAFLAKCHMLEFNEIELMELANEGINRIK